MYLIIYTGKNAKAPQSDNFAEIPNTYKFQPFRVSQNTATSVPEGGRDRRSEVRDQKSEVGDQRSEIRGQRSEIRGRVSGNQEKLNTETSILDSGF
jgi:hypothetical protein